MVWGQARPANNAIAPSAPQATEQPKLTGAGGDLGQPVNPKTYVIGVEDVIHVSVWHEPDITATEQVRSDGMITLALLRDVQAAGLTPERLGKQIADGLSEHLTRPEVTVSVLAVNSKKYTITGGINRPGSFPMVTTITIFEALNQAGGFQPFANQTDVTVIRGTERLHFNYKDYLKKGDKGKNTNNFELQAGDTIYVKP
jgi:polysaccharide export outer membrane protein